MSSLNEDSQSVASAAMAMIGGAAITSFDDSSIEAEIAESLYEDTVQGMLAEHRWRFAAAQYTLNHVTATPTGRWGHAWQIPDGAIEVWTVTSNDIPIEYDIYGGKIYCDADSSSTLVIDYAYRASESEWSGAFRTAVQYRLAAIFAVPLRIDVTMAELLDTRAEMALKRAKLANSQSQTTRKIRTSRFLSQRY